MSENQDERDQKTNVSEPTWEMKQDKWEIRLRINELTSQLITKRSVLHMLAGNFGPLGLIAPDPLKGKILFQDLWKANCKMNRLDKEYMKRGVVC